ncbi:hypothetical protein OE182_12805, partial [Klebsiella pneumoniae]|uniref:hypothetical protein n=1 Tax=Klebsiella pneumoniae TaxID=573 RepID=UPI0021D96DE5
LPIYNLLNQAGITYINKPFLLLIYTPHSIECLFTGHNGGSFGFYFFLENLMMSEVLFNAYLKNITANYFMSFCLDSLRESNSDG